MEEGGTSGAYFWMSLLPFSLNIIIPWGDSDGRGSAQEEGGLKLVKRFYK